MNNNLPPEFSAQLRRGAMFGPVIFTVTGLDLSLYNLAAGIGPDDAPPTVTRISSTQFSVTVPAALTLSLKSQASGAASSGRNTWWVDAVAISDPTVVVPLVGGELTVLARGAHD